MCTSVSYVGWECSHILYCGCKFENNKCTWLSPTITIERPIFTTTKHKYQHNTFIKFITQGWQVVVRNEMVSIWDTSYPTFLLTCYSWLSNSDQTLHTININASCNSTQHIVQNLQSQIQKVEPALRWIKLNKYRWGTVIDNKSLHDMECYL